jgi:2',3'-cyclic-nucleotide 2'-phosphodiesterase (5'-nucleotidase family)
MLTAARKAVNKTRARLLAFSLVLALFPGPAAFAEPLRILHTNDIHSHLLPFRSVSGDTVGGLARLATLVEAQRQDQEAVLLLDAGDLFQGTPFFNYFHGEPEVRCLAAMSYDAMVMGNHELDEGAVNLLAQIKANASFAFLCANVRVPARLKSAAEAGSESTLVTIGRPAIVARAGDIRVGIVGVTTETLPQVVTARGMADVTVLPVIETVGPIVAELRPRCDLVVVLSHCGVGPDSLLAAAVPGIDVIVGGHSHTALATPLVVPNAANDNGVGGTLIVQAGQWGQYLGRLDLEVTGRHITSWSAALLPVTADLRPDRAVRTLIQQYADSLAPLVEEVLAESRAPLSNDAALRAETPLGNLVADWMREARDTDIAVQNGGGLRGNLPAGPVRVRDLFTLLPFDNTLVTMSLDGRGVEQLLAESVARRGQGGFLSVSGLTFTATSEGRVRDIRVGGQPLDPDRNYRLVTNNFTAAGGDGFTAFQRARNVVDTGVLVRDAVIGLVRGAPPIEAPPVDRIRTAPE